MTMLLNPYRFGVAAPIVTDDFSEADGTNLHGKATDTGQTWAVEAGSWDINSGSARSGGFGTAVVPTGVTDQRVVAKATGLSGTNYWELCARYTDTNNFYFVAVRTSEVGIYKQVAGVTTQLGANFSSGANGDIFELRVVGTAITVYKNDVEIGSRTDSALAAGAKAGLRGTSSGLTFDDFAVYAA